ncbi:MAG: hypothetical protein ACRDSH_23645 [Pseudonocardiaceae bacterium]
MLLIAAMGLLVVALGTGHAALAWGSVALSVLVAALILRRWRRSWLQRQDTPEEDLEEDEDQLIDAELGEQPLQLASVTARQQEANPDPPAGGGDSTDDGAQPGVITLAEEDTDAADLLVVYELDDEVLVIDEYPRYHLARCRLADHEHAEHLPVREARQLGFTPCARCRPDTTLARKHRADRATANESSS